MVAAAGCGSDQPPAPAGPRETPEYRDWKGGQAVRRLASNAAGRMPGTVILHLPDGRAKDPADFVELFVNGEFAHRAAVRSAAGPIAVAVGVGPGPAWLDLWDSTTNRHYRHSVDTRQGTDFAFELTADGYDLRQSRRD